MEQKPDINEELTPEARRRADEEIKARRAKRKRRTAGRTVALVIVWLVVIAAVVFLTLFIASKIGEFDSISDMLEFIKNEI
jgi:cell division septal protein FtsQ